MSKRLELHELFVDLLGSRQVYFQPPSTVQMRYPCIVYKRNTNNVKWANGQLYNHKVGYLVTIIDSNPDSEFPEKVSHLPLCRFDRHYTANNLNHDVYVIYY